MQMLNMRPLLLLLLLPLLLLLLQTHKASADTVAWSRIGASVRRTQPQASRHWAVLVAGSNTWSNYRHQADVCHAYQILRRHGVPEHQIITMMYDDIANNEENPTPGKIINRPNGSDVYAGVRIDYSGKHVTPENFLKVLKGEGSGKVLKSGANDYVFINFADHGAPGLVAFPRGVLKAKELMNALQHMHANSMYGKLVFYMEACESGSMFDRLLKSDTNIYATTAADPKQSSYACYYDRKRGTYLGDLYSVNWMEDSDAENLQSETLDRQFELVKERTNMSHVMKYGDPSLGSLPVGDFQGNSGDAARTSQPAASKADAVSQRAARVTALRRRIADANNGAGRLRLELQLRQLLERSERVADVFDRIVRASLEAVAHPYDAAGTARFLTFIRYSLTNFNCHHEVVDEIHRRCFNLGETEEALEHVYKIVNLCESRIGTAHIVASVRSACPQPQA